MRLLNDNIIAIGLYRMKGATDNPYNYIYTNPSHNVKLTKNDRVFVIGFNIREEYFSKKESLLFSAARA